VQKTPDGGSPARTFYWIGQFEDGVFSPDFSSSKDLEIVNGFLSPAVTTDNDGYITAIGIIPDEVNPLFQQAQGWANLFSVPQVWELDANDNILISSHPKLESLRGSTTSLNEITIQDGGSDYLDYNGRYFEMEAAINTGTASEVGFIFGKSPNSEEYYKVTYNLTNQEWIVDATNSSKSNLVRKDIRKGSYSITSGSTFNVRIFIDGSVLEVFIDDVAHFTGRFFPTFKNATGVDLFAAGGTATADITIYTIND
jgi:sucrose-6-phosphate hydrolase SacC (GH32 family)